MIGKSRLYLMSVASLALVLAASSMFAAIPFARPAFAHTDPALCTGPDIAQDLKVFRPGLDGLFGTPDDVEVNSSGALVEGEVVAFQTEITANTDAPDTGCAIDDGTLIIVDPAGVVNDVAPGGVPCLGGTTTVDDTIGPADCSPVVDSFTSNRTLAQYTVDCEDVSGGPERLRYSAVWNGLLHNEADDADAAPQDNTRNDSRHCASTSLTKTASADGVPEGTSIDVNAGANVTFTYRETNDGTTALFGVTVVDPDCAPLVRQADAPGNDDLVLDPAETWVFTCSKIFASPGTFTNTATAAGETSATTGEVLVTNPPDTDETASAEVNVEGVPSTNLTKTADKDVYKPGETIHYNVTETNTGTSAIVAVVVTDSNAGVLGAPDSGDTGNDGVLSPGETWVWNYDRLVTEEDCDTSIHNTVNATGFLIGTEIRAPDEFAEETVRVICEVIVGGEILGIDASALLIAGAGANVFTILPILGGIAGAVFFAVRRWK
jgi:hypothetical protein